jgi:hypothetical protein
MMHAIGVETNVTGASERFREVCRAHGLPPPRRCECGVDLVELTGMTVEDALEALQQARIESIKRQIAAGSYLTEHKLDVVVDRLAVVLRRISEQYVEAGV